MTFTRRTGRRSSSSRKATGLIGANGLCQQKPGDMRLVSDGANEQGDAFMLWGYVAYHSMLFAVSMRVHKDGLVEMLDDDPIGEIIRLH